MNRAIRLVLTSLMFALAVAPCANSLGEDAILATQVARETGRLSLAPNQSDLSLNLVEHPSSECLMEIALQTARALSVQSIMSGLPNHAASLQGTILGTTATAQAETRHYPATQSEPGLEPVRNPTVIADAPVICGKLDGNRYKIVVQFAGPEQAIQTREFIGTRHKIQEAIEKDVQLPAKQRENALRTLQQQAEPELPLYLLPDILQQLLKLNQA